MWAGIYAFGVAAAASTRAAVGQLHKLAAAGQQPLPRVTLEHCNAFLPGKELVDFVSGAGALLAELLGQTGVLAHQLAHMHLLHLELAAPHLALAASRRTLWRNLLPRRVPR